MELEKITAEDAEIVRGYIAKNLAWLRRYEGHRPGVLNLVDRIQSAVDAVEVEIADGEASVEQTAEAAQS